MRRILGLFVAVSMLLTPLTAQQKLRDLKPGWNLFSKDQDIQLGQEAAAQVEREMPVINHSQLSAYLERVGRRLTQSPKADKYPYTFKLVSDTSINAFALPGGPTFVNTGLILAADNEAQLAGVIAHEISHVALRHGTNQASKANLIQLPAMLAGAMAGGGMMGQLAQLGIGLGANSVLLKFSRNAERDADLLGARLMNDAGWNPIEMARFFEKLEASGGSRGPQFLSDHPNPGNRVKAVEAEIQMLPRRDYNYSAGDFQQMKALVKGLPAAPKKTQSGAVQSSGPVSRPNVRVSGNFTEFRAQVYSIQHPDNWRAYPDQNTGTLLIAPEGGVVQGGQGVQIGYGVQISFSRGQGDLRRDTDELVRGLLQSNQGMQVGGEGVRQVRVAGQQALLTMLYGQSIYQNEREVVALVTIERPEGLCAIAMISPQSDYQNLQPVYERILQSIRFR